MRDRMLGWVGFVLILPFLVHCTHVPSAGTGPSGPVGADSKRLGWEAVRVEQANRSIALKSLTGKLSVEFDGAGDSVRGLGTCGAYLPDNFLLEIRDPVGRLHFRAVNRGEQFEGYFPRFNKLYRDKRSGRLFFAKTWALPVSFKDLSRLAAGLLPEGFEPPKDGELAWNGKRFTGKLSSQGKEIQIEVEPDGKSLSRLTWNSPSGEVEVNWRDFRPCCQWMSADPGSGKDFGFAHVIDVKTKATNVAIDWKSLQRWEGAESIAKFAVQAEPSTKVITLE